MSGIPVVQVYSPIFVKYQSNRIIERERKALKKAEESAGNGNESAMKMYMGMINIYRTILCESPLSFGERKDILSFLPRLKKYKK